MAALFKQSKLLIGAVFVALVLSGLPATAQATEDKPPYDWTVRALSDRAKKLEEEIMQFSKMLDSLDGPTAVRSQMRRFLDEYRAIWDSINDNFSEYFNLRRGLPPDVESLARLRHTRLKETLRRINDLLGNLPPGGGPGGGPAGPKYNPNTGRFGQISAPGRGPRGPKVRSLIGAEFMAADIAMPLFCHENPDACKEDPDSLAGYIVDGYRRVKYTTDTIYWGLIGGTVELVHGSYTAVGNVVGGSSSDDGEANDGSGGSSSNSAKSPNERLSSDYVSDSGSSSSGSGNSSGGLIELIRSLLAKIIKAGQVDDSEGSTGSGTGSGQTGSSTGSGGDSSNTSGSSGGGGAEGWLKDAIDAIGNALSSAVKFVKDLFKDDPPPNEPCAGASACLTQTVDDYCPADAENCRFKPGRSSGNELVDKLASSSPAQKGHIQQFDLCTKVSPDESGLCDNAPDRPHEEVPAGGSPIIGEGIWCGDPKAMPDPDQDNCGSNGGGIEYIGPSTQKPSNVDCDMAPDPEIGGCGQPKGAVERDPISPLVQ